MKRKTICISALTAALVMAAGFSAFAAGWEQDASDGRWRYLQDNGSYIYAKEFTDPADGSKYYFDPDGYMMTETRVDGFWFGADGKRVEKTEAEIAAEEARKQREANKPRPSKVADNAKEAAKVARAAGVATHTDRYTFQTEMRSLMDAIFIDARNRLKALDGKETVGGVLDNSTEVTYSYPADERGDIITSSLWKSASDKSANYKPYVLEFYYYRGRATNDNEVNLFNDIFRKLAVAGLGTNNGQALYDRVMAEALWNGAAFDLEGYTDSYNTYAVHYENDTARVRVTCTDYVPETTAETTAEGTDAAAEGTEAAATETAVTETTDTAATTETVAATETTVTETTDTAVETETAAETETVAETTAEGTDAAATETPAETEAPAETEVPAGTETAA